MSKKGQGLSLNTIIVAIVVLIVLVVLIMIFTGYFGSRFTPEVTSCANSGGVCQADSEDSAAPCGYDAFDTPKAKLSATCDTGICCARGLGDGSAPQVKTAPTPAASTCAVDPGCVDSSICTAEVGNVVDGTCKDAAGKDTGQVCCKEK
jgi:hypothetical protein